MLSPIFDAVLCPEVLAYDIVHNGQREQNG